MSSERQQRPRQEPVSCESCRKKKLKCSRSQPCSNCEARGISCDFRGQIVGSTAQAPLISSPRANETASLRSENAAIKARLERLEEIIYSGQYVFESDERPAKIRRIADSTWSTTGIVSPATSISNTPDTEIAKTYRGDFQWLECVGTQENTRLSDLSTPFAVRVVPLESIVHRASSDGPHDRVILLPPRELAIRFFDKYIERVDPLQHLIHGPTTRRKMELLYTNLQADERIEPNQTVLLLSIFASIASYTGLMEAACAFETPRSAINVAVLWLRTAMDILEHVRRCTSATLETVQASAIIIFLVYHIEGYSPKVRAMLFSSLAVAKELYLHRTDDPSSQPPAISQDDIVVKEVRRRVWWHLVATDWGLSFAGGPHEGTYNVNPNHMKVKRPRNVSDEELETNDADFDHPLSVPTIMAYYLARIRLSETCREIGDMIWKKEIDEVSVDELRFLDSKFETLLSDFPAFFRVDWESGQKSPQVDIQDHQLRLQCYIANLTVQARRCKFHLPFLLRASFDADYTFSREICLRAARTVILIRNSLSLEPHAIWIANVRLCGMLGLFFYAIVVLTMDLCVNRGHECEQSRKQEIQEACQTLEEAKRQSACAGMYLDSLVAILRKHRIRLQSQGQAGDYDTGSCPSAADTDALVPGTRTATNEAPNDAFDGLDFDEVWQSWIDMDLSLDPQNWETLISDIETLYPSTGPFQMETL